MSARLENSTDSFAAQLEELDEKLNATTDDVQMLADIHKGIGDILASSSDAEDEIREILHQTYDDGGLRRETFQLVESMLDRYVSETVPTYPTPAKAARTEKVKPVPRPEPVAKEPGDDAFGTTTVIPVDEKPVNPSDTRVQVGSVLRDRYLLQEKVSGGSMGVVYKALDRRLAEAGSKEHWVAIKVLSPELAKNGQALRALQQEAAKGRCLSHPNIVRFIDLDREDELYFLVIEWLDGRTLADILDSADRVTIDLETAFKIVRQIGDALDYAHRCGIVHADIKPGNIMIAPNGDAKLFDFGVARVRQEHFDTKFDPGILGALTPAYSSMQVLTGEEPNVADDVFSLACLFYRLAAGYRVFGPRNAAEASEEGMKPQRVQAISDDQWRALKKALSYSRVTRFNTVKEFVDALGAAGDGAVNLVAPERPVTRKTGRRGTGLIAIFLVLGLVGTAAYQFGYLESLESVLEPFRNIGADNRVTTNEPPPAEEVTVPEVLEDTVPAVEDTSAADDTVPDDILEPDAEPLEDSLTLPLVDYSVWPEADVVVNISDNASGDSRVATTLREDGASVIIEFVRSDDLDLPLSLRLEEVGFSGNRSPWAAGQYTYSDDGRVYFPSGQDRARVSLAMAPDNRREADQVSTLRLRDVDFPSAQFAVVSVTLEDDDQRNFESSLPANTVAFAARQVSVRELDPAVQIDLIRFNPDDAAVEVDLQVIDITATESEDYFAPGNRSALFGPGQRTARILIPLVHDTDVEGDEMFVIELIDVPEIFADDVHQRVVVIIRDN